MAGKLMLDNVYPDHGGGGEGRWCNPLMGRTAAEWKCSRGRRVSKNVEMTTESSREENSF